MEKSISKGLVYPQTVKIIERNGGEVGHHEINFRNIQQVRPYLNTGATLVIFKSGEYVYYNERGTWNDVSASMTQSITRRVSSACSRDESSEVIILSNNRGMNLAHGFQRDRGPPAWHRSLSFLNNFWPLPGTSQAVCLCRVSRGRKVIGV